MSACGSIWSRLSEQEKAGLHRRRVAALCAAEIAGVAFLPDVLPHEQNGE